MVNIRKYFEIAIVIILALMILYICYLSSQNRKLKAEVNMSKQNIYALNDTLRESKNKLGQKEYSIGLYVSKIEDLEKLNKNLYSELKKERENVLQFQQITSEISGQLCEVKNKLINYDIGNYGLQWEFKNESLGYSRFLKGESKFFLDTSNRKIVVIDKGSKLYNDQTTFVLNSGLRKNKETDKYEIFVRSDYPNVKFKVESVIDPDVLKFDTGIIPEKHWVLGVGACLGFSGYTSKFAVVESPTYSVGLTVSYKIISW